jgi:predicted Ser/Thr protein kinase
MTGLICGLDEYGPLIDDPSEWVTGKARVSTNRVLFATYEGKDVVVKRVGPLARVAYAWYRLRDNTREGLFVADQGLEEEVRRLQTLEGLDCVPDLLAYDGRTLVREHIEGEDFREYAARETNKGIMGLVLISGLAGLDQIHARGVAFGAHAKNIVVPSLKPSFATWIDFDGVYHSRRPLAQRQALDLLSYIRTASRILGDTDAGKQIAIDIKDQSFRPYKQEKVVEALREEVGKLSARGELNAKLRRVLL